MHGKAWEPEEGPPELESYDSKILIFYPIRLRTEKGGPACVCVVYVRLCTQAYVYRNVFTFVI